MHYYDMDAKIYRGDPYEPSDPSRPYDNYYASIGAPTVSGGQAPPTSAPTAAEYKSDTSRSTQAMKDLAGTAQTAGSVTGSKQASKLGSALGTIASVAALFSDKRAKRPVYSDMDAKDVVPLTDAGTKMLQVSPQGRAFYVDSTERDTASVPKASLSGRSSVGASMPAPERPKAKAASAGKPKASYREMTPDELSREAAKMMAQFRGPSGPSAVEPTRARSLQYEDTPLYSDEDAKRAAFMDGVHYSDAVSGDTEIAAGRAPARGAPLPAYMHKSKEDGRSEATPTRNVDGQVTPIARGGGLAGGARSLAGSAYGLRLGHRPASQVDDGAMADARRAMAPSAYAYKDEFRPPEQAPGEVNVGPMAQNMAKDPIASTAIKVDPKTGMMAIDRDKALKLVMGSLADLQSQVDARR